MALLEIKDLYCGYDSRPVIKGVSFAVEKGNFVGIIGPNGAGKTTLFRAITATLPLQKGSVLYNNAPISRIPAKRLAGEMAVIPQFMHIPFAFTVEEFVFMGRFAHLDRFQAPSQRDYELTNDALKLAGISGLSKRNVTELSGGERQMALLAQGFAQQPQILLLDEPTAHLDITHQVAIMGLLKGLNRKSGLTIVVILHDLNLASEYCQRIILLDNGKVFKQGAAEGVLTYQNIEEVYRTVVLVEKNPISGRPYILLVSEKERQAE